MSTDLPTLTLSATRKAILATASSPVLAQALSDGAGSMEPRVSLGGLPAPGASGWLCAAPDNEAGSAFLSIVLHRDVRTRTVYLVIDRDNAPLTGNYTVAVTDGVNTYSETYDATSAAPADVDELLQGIADAINAATGGDIGDLVVASAYAVETGGDLNAIRLVGNVTDPVSSFYDFQVTSSTSFPGGAALVLYGELPEATTAELFFREGASVLPAAQNASSAPYLDAVTAWKRVADIASTLSGGTIGPLGYCERIDVFGGSSIVCRVSGTLTDTYGTLGTTRIPLAYTYLLPARVS